MHLECGAGWRAATRTRGNERGNRETCARRTAMCTLLAATCGCRAAKPAASSSVHAARGNVGYCAATGVIKRAFKFELAAHGIEKATQDIELKDCASLSPFKPQRTYINYQRPQNWGSRCNSNCLGRKSKYLRQSLALAPQCRQFFQLK